jgi:hypothetical protein
VKWTIERGLARRPHPRQPTVEQLAFLESEPPADYGVALLCHAYARLSTERPLGFGCVGPIPASMIESWCLQRGYDDDVIDWFCDVIAIVDAETMRRQQKPK